MKFRSMVLVYCAISALATPANSEFATSQKQVRTANDLAGIWALRAQGKYLMVFEIKNSAKGLTATWTEPGSYDTNGDYFNKIANTEKIYRAQAIKTTPENVELVFDSPWPGGAPDRFVIELTSDKQAAMKWAAFAATPYRLTRVAIRPSLGPWQDDRGYVPDADRPTNPEMTAIFEADQADRSDLSNINWKAVRPADVVRRERTKALLDNGRLSSGEDYYHAAYVYQHGETPADFLKAHALAMIALARGRQDAVWLAAATLDRYLQYSGRSQIYGTQFTRPNSAFTQEPYDSGLLSDALREASNVPSLSDQDKQREEYDKMIK